MPSSMRIDSPCKSQAQVYRARDDWAYRAFHGAYDDYLTELNRAIALLDTAGPTDDDSGQVRHALRNKLKTFVHDIEQQWRDYLAELDKLRETSDEAAKKAQQKACKKALEDLKNACENLNDKLEATTALRGADNKLLPSVHTWLEEQVDASNLTRTACENFSAFAAAYDEAQYLKMQSLANAAIFLEQSTTRESYNRVFKYGRRELPWYHRWWNFVSRNDMADPKAFSDEDATALKETEDSFHPISGSFLLSDGSEDQLDTSGEPGKPSDEISIETDDSHSASAKLKRYSGNLQANKEVAIGEMKHLGWGTTKLITKDDGGVKCHYSGRVSYKSEDAQCIVVAEFLAKRLKLALSDKADNQTTTIKLDKLIDSLCKQPDASWRHRLTRVQDKRDWERAWKLAKAVRQGLAHNNVKLTYDGKDICEVMARHLDRKKEELEAELNACNKEEQTERKPIVAGVKGTKVAQPKVEGRDKLEKFKALRFSNQAEVSAVLVELDLGFSELARLLQEGSHDSPITKACIDRIKTLWRAKHSDGSDAMAAAYVFSLMVEDSDGKLVYALNDETCLQVFLALDADKQAPIFQAMQQDDYLHDAAQVRLFKLLLNNSSNKNLITNLFVNPVNARSFSDRLDQMKRLLDCVEDDNMRFDLVMALIKAKPNEARYHENHRLSVLSLLDQMLHTSPDGNGRKKLQALFNKLTENGGELREFLKVVHPTEAKRLFGEAFGLQHESAFNPKDTELKAKYHEERTENPGKMSASLKLPEASDSEVEKAANLLIDRASKLKADTTARPKTSTVSDAHLQLQRATIAELPHLYYAADEAEREDAIVAITEPSKNGSHVADSLLHEDSTLPQRWAVAKDLTVGDTAQSFTTRLDDVLKGESTFEVRFHGQDSAATINYPNQIKSLVQTKAHTTHHDIQAISYRLAGIAANGELNRVKHLQDTQIDAESLEHILKEGNPSVMFLLQNEEMRPVFDQGRRRPLKPSDISHAFSAAYRAAQKADKGQTGWHSKAVVSLLEAYQVGLLRTIPHRAHQMALLTLTGVLATDLAREHAEAMRKANKFDSQGTIDDETQAKLDETSQKIIKDRNAIKNAVSDTTTVYDAILAIQSPECKASSEAKAKAIAHLEAVTLQQLAVQFFVPVSVEIAQMLFPDVNVNALTGEQWQLIHDRIDRLVEAAATQSPDEFQKTLRKLQQAKYESYDEDDGVLGQVRETKVEVSPALPGLKAAFDLATKRAVCIMHEFKAEHQKVRLQTALTAYDEAQQATAASSDNYVVPPAVSDRSKVSPGEDSASNVDWSDYGSEDGGDPAQSSTAAPNTAPPTSPSTIDIAPDEMPADPHTATPEQAKTDVLKTLWQILYDQHLPLIAMQAQANDPAVKQLVQIKLVKLAKKIAEVNSIDDFEKLRDELQQELRDISHSTDSTVENRADAIYANFLKRYVKALEKIANVDQKLENSAEDLLSLVSSPLAMHNEHGTSVPLLPKREQLELAYDIARQGNPNYPLMKTLSDDDCIKLLRRIWLDTTTKGANGDDQNASYKIFFRLLNQLQAEPDKFNKVLDQLFKDQELNEIIQYASIGEAPASLIARMIIKLYERMAKPNGMHEQDLSALATTLFGYIDKSKISDVFREIEHLATDEQMRYDLLICTPGLAYTERVSDQYNARVDQLKADSRATKVGELVDSGIKNVQEDVRKLTGRHERMKEETVPQKQQKQKKQNLRRIAHLATLEELYSKTLEAIKAHEGNNADVVEQLCSEMKAISERKPDTSPNIGLTSNGETTLSTSDSLKDKTKQLEQEIGQLASTPNTEALEKLRANLFKAIKEFRGQLPTHDELSTLESLDLGESLKKERRAGDAKGEKLAHSKAHELTTEAVAGLAWAKLPTAKLVEMLKQDLTPNSIERNAREIWKLEVEHPNRGRFLLAALEEKLGEAGKDRIKELKVAISNLDEETGYFATPNDETLVLKFEACLTSKKMSEAVMLLKQPRVLRSLQGKTDEERRLALDLFAKIDEKANATPRGLTHAELTSMFNQLNDGTYRGLVDRFVLGSKLTLVLEEEHDGKKKTDGDLKDQLHNHHKKLTPRRVAALSVLASNEETRGQVANYVKEIQKQARETHSSARNDATVVIDLLQALNVTRAPFNDKAIFKDIVLALLASETVEFCHDLVKKAHAQGAKGPLFKGVVEAFKRASVSPEQLAMVQKIMGGFSLADPADADIYNAINNEVGPGPAEQAVWQKISSPPSQANAGGQATGPGMPAGMPGFGKRP